MSNFNRGGRPDRERSGGYGGRSSGSFDRGGFKGRGGFEKQMFSAVCAECGNNCQVPFRPTNNKPVYCNDCFRREDNFEPRKPNRFKEEDSFKYDAQGVKFDKYKQEFEKLNQKLDTILKALDGNKKAPIAKDEPKHIEEVIKDLDLDMEKPAKKSKKAKDKEEVKKPAKKAAKKSK